MRIYNGRPSICQCSCGPSSPSAHVVTVKPFPRRAMMPICFQTRRSNKGCIHISGLLLGGRRRAMSDGACWSDQWDGCQSEDWVRTGTAVAELASSRFPALQFPRPCRKDPLCDACILWLVCMPSTARRALAWRVYAPSPFVCLWRLTPPAGRLLSRRPWRWR